MWGKETEGSEIIRKQLRSIYTKVHLISKPMLFLLITILMALHSSTLAWKIPWAEELGRRQSMGSLRVRHDWATSLSLFTFMHGRKKWQPTPMFLPGESQGQGSLVGCRLWGHTESDTTEVTQKKKKKKHFPMDSHNRRTFICKTEQEKN